MPPSALRHGAVLAAVAGAPLLAWLLAPPGGPLLPLVAVAADVGLVAVLALRRPAARAGAAPAENEADRKRHGHLEEQLTLLVEASANLSSSLELPAVLGAILDLSRRLVAADAHAVWRLHADTGRWSIASAAGLSEAYQREVIQMLERTPGMADNPIVAEDVHALPLLADRRAAYRAEGIRSILVAPLRLHGRPSGTLVFYYRTPHRFGEVEVRVATALANLAATAIGTAEAYAAQSRLRTEAEAAYEEARDAARQKDEFLAMLSHELRNPLAAVRNAVTVFRLIAPDDTNLLWAREVVERQVQHLTRLVDDLLDVSRVARGKVQLRKAPLDLATVVARAVETSRPLIEARRHHLTVQLPDEPVRLEGDLTRLAQVLANLLNNAAKYTDEGGQITLTVGRDGDEVVLRVRDTGIGIAPELLPHVFDLFTQADRSLARAEGGLGIGLTLVRSLVELHGGRVEAASAGPGQGSEFALRLPALAGGRPAEPARAPGDAAGVAPRRRVLVVDDNRDAAGSLALLLQLRGHEVRTAFDGPSALEAARAHRPEVVLLDLGLPGMDGYEVARRLRQDATLAGVRLVAVTGHGQEEDRRRSEEAGFGDHLVKPVDLADVERVLAAPAPAARRAAGA